MSIAIWFVELLGSGLALLFIAALGWFAASRAATSAIAGSLAAPGRRAIAHSCCTATLVIVALVLGQPDTAVAIIFGTSVLYLTFVLPWAIFMVDPNQQPAPHRFWALLLPASLIMLLIGLRGMFAPAQVAVLVLEGIALALYWNDSPPRAETVTGPKSAISTVRIALFLMAIAAAAVASIAGVLAARTFSDTLMLPRTHLATGTVLAANMVLPLLFWGVSASHEGQFDTVLTTIVGCVLLNLCALLPLAAILWPARPYAIAGMHWLTRAAPTTAPSTAPASAPSTAPATEPAALPGPLEKEPWLAYPISIWRVDTVLLVAIGLLLFPVAFGKWNLGLAEGGALLVTTLIYLFLLTSVAIVHRL